MRTATLLLALLLATLTPHAVAARCAGESQNGVQICACTVRSRLKNGWEESLVLSAYYAKDSPATPEQLQQATDGLNGIGCIGTEYFLFSRADMRLLGLRESCAVAHAGGVYAFGRDALKVCKRG